MTRSFSSTAMTSPWSSSSSSPSSSSRSSSSSSSPSRFQTAKWLCLHHIQTLIQVQFAQQNIFASGYSQEGCRLYQEVARAEYAGGEEGGHTDMTMEPCTFFLSCDKHMLNALCINRLYTPAMQPWKS